MFNGSSFDEKHGTVFITFSAAKRILWKKLNCRSMFIYRLTSGEAIKLINNVSKEGDWTTSSAKLIWWHNEVNVIQANFLQRFVRVNCLSVTLPIVLFRSSKLFVVNNNFAKYSNYKVAKPTSFDALKSPLKTASLNSTDTDKWREGGVVGKVCRCPYLN